MPASITYAHEHHIFTLSPKSYPQWTGKQTQWTFEGLPAIPPVALTGTAAVLPPGWQKKEMTGWDEDAIQKTLDEKIGQKLARTAGSVTISRNGSGAVVFTGTGLTGRQVDLNQAAALTIAALEKNIAYVTLPVTITQPTVTVNDPDLQAMGVKEVVTIGESDFTGSPRNRQHNIAVGISRFNGHVIPQGSTFSFNEILGPVNGQTGFVKELVIQGDKTIPDYGGGLCQVSSTAYRGPWEYGLPIVQRKNHSYAVGYYAPQGTDATIYPPKFDMKFVNDTPGALLIQSLTIGTKAYFIYYGTHDDRQSNVAGPFVWDFVYGPPGERIIYAYDPAMTPPGEKKRVSEKHDGMKVDWYRTVTMPGQNPKVETYFSFYETRQLTYQIGVEAGDIRAASGGTLSVEPTWLPTSD